jgi:RNA polymerase sigma factor (sigma-70 family)
MLDSPADQVLVDMWRAGNEDAARQIFDRYVDRLMAVARHRISERLQSRFGPEDVVQSVFRTFFSHARDGEFSISNQDDLCRLLMRITVHKALSQVAFHKAAKRDAGRELDQGPLPGDRVQQLLDHHPGPAEAESLVDELVHFVNQLRPADRQILEMRMQGYTNDVIASKLQVSDRQIRRIMERIRGLARQSGTAGLSGGK